LELVEGWARVLRLWPSFLHLLLTHSPDPPLLLQQMVQLQWVAL
jgi:hypothetical protein